jgi:hypothetical protein
LYSHTKCYEGYQVKEDELGGACSEYEEIKNACNIGREPEGKRLTGRLGVNSRIILKWILKRWCEDVGWINLA